MLYAAKHPLRTIRWWRYRLSLVLSRQHQALAARLRQRRAELRSRRALIDMHVEPARPAAQDRGELIARSVIGHDGEVAVLPLPNARDARFDRRPPLVPRDGEGRHVW